jgi:hypothetical protein
MPANKWIRTTKADTAVSQKLVDQRQVAEAGIGCHLLQLRRAKSCRFRLDLVHLLEMQFAEASSVARTLT